MMTILNEYKGSQTVHRVLKKKLIKRKFCEIKVCHPDYNFSITVPKSMVKSLKKLESLRLGFPQIVRTLQLMKNQRIPQKRKTSDPQVQIESKDLRDLMERKEKALKSGNKKEARKIRAQMRKLGYHVRKK